MATRTSKKRGRPAKKVPARETVVVPMRPARRSARSPLSENTLLWLAIFFLLFAVLAVMAYYRQVEDNQRLIEFRQQQDERLMKAQPLVSPTPVPKAKARS